jgi:enoyl-CoA hydratase
MPRPGKTLHRRRIVIRLEDREGITVLRLEHGKANALDVELCEALAVSLSRLGSEDASGATVVTGTGNIFSAGVDLFRLLEGGEAYVAGFLRALVDLIDALRSFPKPLIAAINGHAIAGGAVIAFACDYRIMAAGDGTIGVPELRVGVPFPSSALEIVRAAVPRAYLGDVVLRGSLSGSREALAHGLVHEVVDHDAVIDRAVEVGREMSRIPPATFALTRRRLAASGAAVDDAYDAEVEALWKDPEIHAHIRGYLERTIGKSSR